MPATIRLPATSLVRSAERQAGYMLVEMVATLALTALLMTFAFPSAPTGTSAARFTGVAAAAATMLRDARTEAVANGVSVAVQFDAHSRLLRTSSSRILIPRDVAVSVLAGGMCPSDATARTSLVFRSDGTNCGGVFRFAWAGRVLTVRVDWTVGRVDVVAEK